MLVQNVNPNKLHDELVANGIVPISVKHDREEGETIAANTWIEFEEGTDLNAVQAIIDVHDPTPLPKPPTDKERLESVEEALLLLLMEG